MAAPGCNQCGDGLAAPPSCDHSAQSVAACRARVAEQIEACYVRHIADLPGNTARAAWFQRMVERRRDPARISELRRKVFALLVAEGRAVVPAREQPAELEFDW